MKGGVQSEWWNCEEKKRWVYCTNGGIKMSMITKKIRFTANGGIAKKKKYGCKNI